MVTRLVLKVLLMSSMKSLDRIPDILMMPFLSVISKPKMPRVMNPNNSVLLKRVDKY